MHPSVLRRNSIGRTYNGQNSGAIGLIAPTEVSYSFVNDTYMWGVFDNLFPGFMPGYTTNFPTSFVMPAFGNAAGKYFLYQSSWVSAGSTKTITYRLFHCHGDAFMTLYTEVPQALAVSHEATLAAGAQTFTVTANAGSTIALVVNGLIIGEATGTGAPLAISIPPQNGNQVMHVTVTKQNYYRYSSEVDIISGGVIANFSANDNTICSGGSVTFTDLSIGPPTSWTWSFPAVTPALFRAGTPPDLLYCSGQLMMSHLTVPMTACSDTETKTGYITVSGLDADFSGTPTTIMQASPSLSPIYPPVAPLPGPGPLRTAPLYLRRARAPYGILQYPRNL